VTAKLINRAGFAARPEYTSGVFSNAQKRSAKNARRHFLERERLALRRTIMARSEDVAGGWTFVLSPLQSAMLALVTVSGCVFLLGAVRVNEIEAAIGSFIANSALTHAAEGLAYRLVTYIADGEFRSDVQTLLGDDDWVSHFLAVVIWGGVGAIFTWRSWANHELARRRSSGRKRELVKNRFLRMQLLFFWRRR
jgi:hypothetical protein